MLDRKATERRWKGDKKEMERRWKGDGKETERRVRRGWRKDIVVVAIELGA